MDSDTLMKKLNLDPLDALLQLLEDESCFMPFSMYKLKSHYFQILLSLRAILINPHEQLVDDDSFKEFTNLASEVGCIMSAFDLNNMDEKSAQKLLKQLRGPLRRLKHWKYMVKFERLVPKPSRMCYPKTDGLGFVDHLVGNLEQLLKTSKADLLGPFKRYVVRLHEILHLTKSSLVQIPEPRREEPDMKRLARRIADIAYEVEYIIDSYLVRKISIWCCISWLRDVLTEAAYETSLVKMELGDVTSIVSVILNSDPNKLNIIPIVIDTQLGMKGITEIFNDPAIVKRFRRRTWSLVSSYKRRKKEVFVDLVLNYRGPRGLVVTWGHVMEMEFREIEWRLQLVLVLGSMCLIILEDVQDIDAIDDIKKVLPKLPYGSTILVTTRSPELAAQLRIDSQQAIADNASTSQIHKPITKEHVVGFQAETKGMLELLTRSGKSNLRLISIVGMAGQGKTTPAKRSCFWIRGMLLQITISYRIWSR